MIQGISVWDVLVFSDGRRRYRFTTDFVPAECQIHGVGTPEYKNEVVLMREQVRVWHERLGTVSLGVIDEAQAVDPATLDTQPSVRIHRISDDEEEE